MCEGSSKVREVVEDVQRGSSVNPILSPSPLSTTPKLITTFGSRLHAFSGDQHFFFALGLDTMDKDLNLVHSEASKTEEASSSRDDHLVGLNDPSPTEIGPAHDASRSDKASSCRYDDMKQIKDKLTARIPSKLEVIPIVGMGGIGKTTLAKSVYEDTGISYHFNLRAWVTISQEYERRNVLHGLLGSMDSLSKYSSKLGDEELVEVCYKSLKGRRFLVVLDDVWKSETWNDLKWIFPNDNNGSRIILTSRLMEVAEYAEPDSPPYCMNCLSNEESWRLLHNEVFIGKPCPSHLVEIGHEIAKKCQGLPLAIVVVARHLSKIKNQDCWADVAKQLDSLITGDQEQILDILCLSYSYLPQRLKSCFLYMGNFPKNSEIHFRKLIRLWIAMGFVHAGSSKNLEDEAERCLEDLISRHLIMVRKKKYDGRIKTCGVHDLLCDLILREARREDYNFFSHSIFSHSQFTATTDNTRQLIRALCFKSLYIPRTITDFVDLRYLELYIYDDIPESVYKLRNLETIICHRKWARKIFLPKEIWLLQRLRHLQIGTRTFLANTSDATCEGSSISNLPELQTLSTISFASCTEQVLSRFPNLKRFKICDINGEADENLFNFLHDLVYLHRLEKLNLLFSKGVKRQQQIPWCDFFPSSVKELTLKGCHLPWEDMNILGMLPNLEVLKLKNEAFEGPVYEQTMEGFSRLKVVLFEDLNFEQWIDDNTIDQFPILQHLILRRCELLKGIPYCIGEIPTLKSIELYGCSRSATESARAIQREQRSMGNYDLEVRIIRRLQILVLKLKTIDGKIKEKALQAAVSFPGVHSVEIDTNDKKMTVVVSDYVDAVEIINRVRKICHIDIVSIAPVVVAFPVSPATNISSLP